MGKRVRFDEDARRALWRGIDQLATAVRITLGPRGRSVVLDRAHGLMPAITRDGIAVAQELELPDPFENMACRCCARWRSAPGRRREMERRPPRSSPIASSATASRRSPRRQPRGLAPRHRRRRGRRARGAGRAGAAAGRRARRARVAALAAGDPQLGELIAQALRAVGPHGVITVEEGHGLGVTLEVVDGVRFPGGYASPYFVTDAESMEGDARSPARAGGRRGAHAPGGHRARARAGERSRTAPAVRL
jgi:chaperonin GroEL